jgi:predicted DNA-binding mobile mystery protein A
MITAAQQLDRRFSELRPLLEKAERPSRGWIKAVREALGMTSAQLASRMGVAQPRIAELEKAEANRNVTLKSIDRAAEALGCRVVYILVPERPLETVITDRASQVADDHLKSIDQTMRLEDQAVSDRARRAELKQDLIRSLLKQPSRLWQET